MILCKKFLKTKTMKNLLIAVIILTLFSCNEPTQEVAPAVSPDGSETFILTTARPLHLVNRKLQIIQNNPLDTIVFKEETLIRVQLNAGHDVYLLKTAKSDELKVLDLVPPAGHCIVLRCQSSNSAKDDYMAVILGFEVTKIVNHMGG